MKGYLPIEAFCELHDLDCKKVMYFITKHKELCKKSKKEIFINNDYIISQFEKKRRFTNFAHEIYYALLEIFETEYAIAKRLTMYGSRNTYSWYDYISGRMWNVSDCILDFHISKLLIDFIIQGSRLLYLYYKDK